MISKFQSPLSGDLYRFLEFKRRLGYPYVRAEATLAAFDRFLRQYVAHRHGWQLDQAMLVWLASRPQRKAVSVSVDASVLRQLCRYLRRDPRGPQFRDPLWPKLPTESVFVPYVLSNEEIRRVLDLAGQLSRPRFRASVYRMLIVLLYGTGLRFGEALRLRVKDVDTQGGVLFVELFKGRARWVPFHRSLSREFDTYLKVRGAFAPARPEDRVFVGANRQTLPVNTASHTIRTLFSPGRSEAAPRAQRTATV
jgi:integrase